MNIDQRMISISKGPQFRDGQSAYLFIFMLMLIIVLIVSLIKDSYLTAIILVPIIVFVFYNMIDVQGVQINKETGLVREYKLKIWGKVGKWTSLKQFHSIRLEYESYNIRVRTIYTQLTTDKHQRYGNEQYGHFVVALVNEDKLNNLELAEAETYANARKLAEGFARRIDLPLIDMVEKNRNEKRVE